MKKTLAILLSLMLAAGAVASCGKKDDKKEDTKTPSDAVTDTTTADEGKEENKDENKEEQKDEESATDALTAEGIITSIYAQKSPEFMYGFVPVDMTDKDSYMTYLGIEDISKIKEAAVSESMIGAQAYSLVVARVADGVDAKEVAEEMKNGINPRKWICVEADDVKVEAIGDLICFCMISTEFKEAFTAQDAIDAFTKVVNGEADYLAENEEPADEVTDETTDETTEDTTDETTDEKVDDVTDKPAAEVLSPDKKGESVADKAEKPAVKDEAAPDVKAEEKVEEKVEVKDETAPEAGATDTTDGAADSTEAVVTPSVSTSGYTLQGIIDSIYAQKAPMFMFGSTPVDISDEYSRTTYLGLKDGSKVSEALVSESMIGAQAYSLVIARVKDSADVKAVADEMKNGIDNRKWICVEADDVNVTTYGDLICFCMIDSEYKDVLTAKDVTDAFTNIMTGKAVYEEGAAPNIPEMQEEPEQEEPEQEEPEQTETAEEPGTTDDGLDEDTVVVGGDGLEAIVNNMYAIKAPQFMFGTLPVDLADAFAVESYLGLTDASKITEAVYSEPMMGAQAYSLVIARVAPGQDAKAVANEMKAGIDPAKWVCVEADDIKVTTKGDLICFCMISTDFASDYTAQDAIDAFNKVA